MVGAYTLRSNDRRGTPSMPELRDEPKNETHERETRRGFRFNPSDRVRSHIGFRAVKAAHQLSEPVREEVNLPVAQMRTCAQ